MWISFVVFKGKSIWKAATCLLVIAGSAIMYFVAANGYYQRPTWAPECYGFVWGIILSGINKEFRTYFVEKWKIKWGVSAVVALVLGVAFLKFKPVPFVGSYLLKIALGLAISLFVLVSNVRINYGNKVNMFLGKISFEVYLIHTVVFELLENKISWLSSGVFILLSIILTVIMAVIVHWITEKIT